MTCSSTFLKYPSAVLAQSPAAYILMYFNAFSTTFTAVHCFQLRKKVLRLDATSDQSSHASYLSFSASLLMPSMETTFWSPHSGLFSKPNYHSQGGHFKKYSHTPQNQLVVWCLSLEPHFGAVYVDFMLNPITAQKMGNLQITVTGLLFIVLGKPLDA